MDSIALHREYWDRNANEKNFVVEVKIDRLKAFVGADGRIVDIGCGYGRVLNDLYHHGFTNLYGADISGQMIERGRKLFPHLNLSVQNDGKVPFEDNTFDAAIIISVLTCMIRDEEQDELIREARRVLKPDGYLYLSDFMINDDERNMARYRRYEEKYGTYGVFETDDGGVFRHHSPERVKDICSDFHSMEFHEGLCTTMNGNIGKAFCFIGKNRKQGGL